MHTCSKCGKEPVHLYTYWEPKTWNWESAFLCDSCAKEMGLWVPFNPKKETNQSKEATK